MSKSPNVLYPYQKKKLQVDKNLNINEINIGSANIQKQLMSNKNKIEKNQKSQVSDK